MKSIVAKIQSLFTGPPRTPRVLFAVSSHPNVKLDCGVPKRCRVPILYETHGAPAAVNAPIIVANPRNEDYSTWGARRNAMGFALQIKVANPTAQVVMYGSPVTQWGYWDNPSHSGFANGQTANHTQLAADAGCDFGPSMYFMDRGKKWDDKHHRNIEVIDRALEVWNIEGRGTPPRVYPFVSVFYAGRHEDGHREPVPVEQTRWLLDTLIFKGWTPVVWAHAYHDGAMMEIRAELYELKEYMR